MNVNQQVADSMDRLARIDKEIDAEEKAKRKRIAQRRQESEYQRDLDEMMREIDYEAD